MKQRKFIIRSPQFAVKRKSPRHGGCARGQAPRLTADCRRGFTLIETAIVVVIVGVAVAAMMVAIGSSTRMNAEANDLTTATLLAQHVREWTSRLPLFDPNTQVAGDYDNLQDFASASLCPPRDGNGLALTDASWADWRQDVLFEYVDENYLSGPAQGTLSETCLGRFTVKVYRGDEPLATLTWVVSLQ